MAKNFVQSKTVTLLVTASLLTNAAYATPPDNTKRIKPLQIITEIPESGKRTLKTAFSKKALLPWAGIAASTVALYSDDQRMLGEVQRWGRNNDVGNVDRTRTVARLGNIPLFRAPSDTGSWLYYLGDGWTHFSIAGSFYLAGQLGAGNRPNNVGLEILHGMVVTTMFSQLIKRSTGRESPSDATEPRGKWRPFPSLNSYQSNTAAYDAFPSGHVMTATLTFTVITQNYPEYAYLTVPLGVVWVTALGLQMMNNGVHWASDYPLGIAMGYVIGKLVSRMGEPEVPGADEKSSFRPAFFPAVAANGTETLNALWTF